MKNKIVTSAYIVYALIDLIIFSISNFSLYPVAILGAIAIVTGVSILMKKIWFVYPAIFFGPLSLTFGAATLYASIQLVGFNPNLSILSFNLALLAYSIIATGLFTYTIANRSTLLEDNFD
jgi:hypothetical protein